MGKARKIEIETRKFEKAGVAVSFFQEMLNRYSIGDRVSGEDEEDLKALLKRHDERLEKEGVGVSHFEVGAAPEHPTNCFWLVRTDQSRIDISFMHCLEKKPYD